MTTRLALLLCALAAGCEGVVPAIDWQQMIEQHKYLPYAQCDLFSDGRAMRTPPPGTIPRDRPPATPQPDRTAALFAIGRDRFQTICATCHGLLGDGDSEVARHMELRKPPSLLGEESRQASDRRLFEIASRGYGLMPAYDADLTAAERWAVVDYLRALQLSQSVRLADLPADLRAPFQQALDEAPR